MRLKHWFGKITQRPLSERRTAAFWVLIVIIGFLFLNGMSEPIIIQAQSTRIVPTAAGEIPAVSTAAPDTLLTPLPELASPTPEPTPTKTPLPDYLLQNFDDTNGVVVGTILLVIIVLLGTISGIRTRRQQHNESQPK